MQKNKMNKEKQDKYLNRFYKIYPILKGFTDDLLFFVAIDTLFLTLVKGLSAQEIVLLTTISSIISILFRVQLIKIIRKLGNTKSVRLGMGLLLLSSILITLGPSFIWIIVGKTLYEIAFVFKDMENVMLQNNLAVKGKTADYVKISNKSTIAYSFITMIIAFISGYIFNINPYLPMYLCVLICIIFFVMYFYMKDISTKDITVEKSEKLKKIKIPKIIWLVLISYGVFYAIIVNGQQNVKLLIQYKLTDVYGLIKVSTYLGIIVSVSRIARLLGNLLFGKVYNKIKDKASIILSSLLFLAFVFTILGHFLIKFATLGVVLMSIGFCIILAVRDPYKLYINNIALKLSKPEERQVVFAYVQYARKIGVTIFSLIISAALIDLEMVYIIIGIGLLAFIEIIVTIKLYRMLKSNINEKQELEYVLTCSNKYDKEYTK